jgi:plastocyanin
MARSAPRLAALLAVAVAGGGAGLAAGGPADARPRAKDRRAAKPRARAVKVDAGRGWVPPAVLGAARAPLTGAAAGNAGAGGGAGSGAPGGAAGTPSTPTTTTTTTPTTTTPPSLAAVGVTVDDRGGYSARLSRATVAAGAVVVQLSNRGEDQHNLRVVQTDPGGPAPEDFDLTDPGQQTTRTLTLAPGTYYLFCTLTTPVNHAAAGMSATLTVTAAP